MREGECESVCGVGECVSSLSPLLLPFSLSVPLLWCSCPCLALCLSCRVEGKAASNKSRRQTERRAAGEEREKNTSPQNKSLFLSFSFLCSFPLEEMKKQDKIQLEEVGGCREAGLPGKAGGGNLLLPGRG